MSAAIEAWHVCVCYYTATNKITYMVGFNFSRIKHRFRFGRIVIRYSSHPSSFCIHEMVAVSAGVVAPLKRRPPAATAAFGVQQGLPQLPPSRSCKSC